MNPNDDKPCSPAEAANSRGEGLLVVGHGTRDAAGVAEFTATVRRIAVQLAPLPVEGGFLELATPTIDTAVARLAEAGATRITTAPLILFAAGHAKRDIPAAVAEAAAQHSIAVGSQLPHLGCRPEILALSARRFREACETDTDAHSGESRDAGLSIGPEETLLLMVGRGSRDADATAEMHRFAKLRSDLTPVGRLEVAFTAMAEPSLATALAAVGRLPFRRVVVQPHLLFAGELLDRVRTMVTDAARTDSDRRWVVAGHLGPEPELVAAICASVKELLAGSNID